MRRHPIDLAASLGARPTKAAAPPVALRPVHDEDGREIPFARAVTRLDDGSPVSVVSDRYTLVPHDRILEIVDGAFTRLGLDGESVKGGVFFSRRGARMEILYKIPSLIREVVPGDRLCPLIRITNSYDATTRITIRIGSFRVVCSNLAITSWVSNRFGFSAVHAGEIEIDQVQDELDRYIYHFDDVIGTYRRWTETPWNRDDAETLRGSLDGFGKKTREVVPDGARHRFAAYNVLTDHATRGFRTAAQAIRFLGAVDRGFTALDGAAGEAAPANPAEERRAV